MKINLIQKKCIFFQSEQKIYEKFADLEFKQRYTIFFCNSIYLMVSGDIAHHIIKNKYEKNESRGQRHLG